MRILLLLFNRQIFYILSNVFDNIRDYPESKKRIQLYLNVVKQASNIYDLSSAFAVGLIKAIKKDKSWAIKKWSKHEFEKLLAPLSCHIKADQIGRTRFDGALKTITKYWGPGITGFFWNQNKNEKTLCQFVYFLINSFTYCDAQRLVNAHVMEKLFKRTLQYSG